MILASVEFWTDAYEIVWHSGVEDGGGGCQIEEHHQSPYVTALLTQSVPSYGCMSREFVPETEQQVDVLLLNVSSSWTTSGADRQHVSSAWTTSGHHRSHIYLTVKPSAVYGMFTISSVAGNL